MNILSADRLNCHSECNRRRGAARGGAGRGGEGEVRGGAGLATHVAARRGTCGNFLRALFVYSFGRAFYCAVCKQLYYFVSRCVQYICAANNGRLFSAWTSILVSVLCLLDVCFQNNRNNVVLFEKVERFNKLCY